MKKKPQKKSPKTLPKKPAVKIWRPFFAKINGRPSEPIVLGLTEHQAEVLMRHLEHLRITCTQWLPSELSAWDRAAKTLERRNLKPIDLNEKGAIWATDI